MSLLARLRDIARKEPGRPALRAGGQRKTYGALVDAIERRADAFGEDDPLVRLDGGDPARFVVDFFAARARGLRAIAHPASAPAALSRMRESAASEADWPAGGATVFFSSGSVGASKAVPVSEANLLAAALAFETWGDVTPADRLAVGLSPAQIFGFVRGALNGLLVGAEAVFFTPRRDPLQEAADLGATTVLLPSALVALAARRSSRVALGALRCGGGLVPEAAADAVETVRGVPVRSGYGMTESAGLGARQRGDRPRRAGSCGEIAPGIEVSIVGGDETDRPGNEAGEIRLSGPAVFSGYLSAEDPSPFDGRGRLRTGDVGHVDGSGELHVHGRLAFSLAAGDRVLCAEEVEAAIAEHPGVAEAAAAPGERAFGVLVVLREDSDALYAAVRAHLESRLPGFARPRRIVRVGALPRTPAGKIDRAAVSRWLREK
ncbi:MAG: fatty acid--CoA ligase family protein [Thermoanaerobaculia bacterium]